MSLFIKRSASFRERSDSLTETHLPNQLAEHIMLPVRDVFKKAKRAYTLKEKMVT